MNPSSAFPLALSPRSDGRRGDCRLQAPRQGPRSQGGDVRVPLILQSAGHSRLLAFRFTGTPKRPNSFHGTRSSSTIQPSCNLPHHRPTNSLYHLSTRSGVTRYTHWGIWYVQRGIYPLQQWDNARGRLYHRDDLGGRRDVPRLETGSTLPRGRVLETKNGRSGNRTTTS